ncbi:MAG TPA: SBBP repeat-containing protein [Candidatus Acidoferrum sp.]|nr:SBBP repeat-containing protein [Candidatus Acidoferrum sp.]
MRFPASVVFFSSCALAAMPQSLHVDYATYLGGSSDEQTSGIAVDAAGNAYVVGTTFSPDFPLTSTAFGVPSKDHGCAFVTKLNAAGARVIWSLCLANTTGDRIAVDPAGAAYILTHSDNVSSVTRLTPDGDKVYSKPLGVLASALAVDSNGNVYAAGSAGQDFVTTPGAYKTKLTIGTCRRGIDGRVPVTCPDAFVTKLRSDGGVAYATYLGGSGADQARAIAVDSQGDVWITGDTESPDFPATRGALDSRFHGEIDLGPMSYGDAFVAKLDATGSNLLYSTYLGGSAPDFGFAIAIDNKDAAYVAGATQSPDFPVTPGALQQVYGGAGTPLPGPGGDAFVTKFSASGALSYSTFLGGPQTESANVIAVDAQGEAYVNAFPNVSMRIPTTLSVLSPDGSAILNSAPIGGSFVLDTQGSLYFAQSGLGYLFFPTPTALQPKFGGGTYDATVVKADFTGTPSPWITNLLNAASLRTGTPSLYPVFDIAPGEIITILGSGFDERTRVLFDGIPAPIIYTQSDQINAVVPFELTGPTTSITVDASGQTLGPAAINVFDAVPALFTVDGTGKGQAAVLNQDGVVNSVLNPAQRGSVISVFMTGAGRMTPPQQDDSRGPLSPPFPMTVLGAGSSVGQVLFAGAAPGLVAGAVQINVRISQDVSPGDRVPIVVYIGNYASGFNGDTTIAIR